MQQPVQQVHCRRHGLFEPVDPILEVIEMPLQRRGIQCVDSGRSSDVPPTTATAASAASGPSSSRISAAIACTSRVSST